MIVEILEYASLNSAAITSLTALVAVLVSALSIVLTVTALYIQRKHNYYSTKPIGDIGVWDYDRELVVRVNNKGIGPLRIDSIKVHKVGESRSYIGIKEYMDANGIHANWAHYSGNISGMFVSANNYTTLLKLSGDPDDSVYANSRDRVRKALSSLEVELVYSDIYDRVVGRKTKLLSWFGRHDFDAEATELSANSISSHNASNHED